ncbi:hypothetical protein NDU88_004366 [Pleurodeles waltl]|uniref:Uncharacterized protein n=1 Tax=Pleurodeles waltl TaxID=8319 RepID=A0AAV7WVP0_PLEWA|nr:hypothetical protein NDU88_004366 [Pleurodeles waltl]
MLPRHQPHDINGGASNLEVPGAVGAAHGDWCGGRDCQVTRLLRVPELHKWHAMTLRWAQTETRVLRALRDKGQTHTGYDTCEELVTQLEI